jgi:putative membrane protein
MRFFSILFLVLFVAAIVIFCLQNLETVTVDFLAWGLKVPLPLLTALIYLLGMFSGGALLSLVRRSIRIATEPRPTAPRAS